MKHIIILTVLLAAYSSSFAYTYIYKVSQNSWRWRNNDGSETAATWKAGQDTSINYNSIHDVVRLRIEIVNTSTTTPACPLPECPTHPYTVNMADSLQFSTTPSDALSWKNIGVDTTLPFALAGAGNYVVQDDTTTSQITGSSYAFSPGKIMVSDSVLKNISIPGYRRSEYEWAIRGTSNTAPNTAYYFRQRRVYDFNPFNGSPVATEYPIGYPFLTFENKAPAISIVSPAHDTSYTAPATFTIRAEASDKDGTVSSVKFYNGSTYLKTDFTSPYSYTLSDLAAGTYMLTAKATDNLGAEAVSAAVKITVKSGNKAPTVSITGPANNAVYTAPATVTINATAADSDGTVSSVKFYKDSTYLKADFTSPYSYTLSNLPAGTYSFTAKATDNLGAETVSAAVKLTVKSGNKAPTVSITSPADNVTYTAPATITINAKAADADGSVYSVKFYNGGTYLKTDFTSPYSYTISGLPAGAYLLTAKATDNLGAGTTSDTVKVKVVNGSIVSSKPYAENEKTAPNDAFGLKLSPNPANNVVNIQASGLQQNKPATLSIISILGNVLKTIQISKAATQLDVSSLTSGVYTLKIVNGDKVSYKQFVKW